MTRWFGLPFVAVSLLALVTGCPGERGEPDAAEPAAEPAPAAEAPAGEAPAAPAGTIRLEAAFLPDPHTVRGRAGGPVDAGAGNEETEHGECVGYVPREPQHVLELADAFSHLKVTVESDIDTTLVVEGPGGKRCNDDFPGLGVNPGIEGAWDAGTYRIFVGSYDEEEQGDYTLSITEF